MSVLNLQVLYSPVVVGDSGPVLILPLLSDFLLLDHHSVGLLLVSLVALFRLQYHIF